MINFILHFFRGSFHCGDVNAVIYDDEGACKGQYGFTRRQIWVHLRADMGSLEQYQPG